MRKIVKNEIIMSIKDSTFLRCCLYTFFSVMCLVMMTWMLGNALPQEVGEILSGLSKTEGIDLGFIEFESLDQIREMTPGEMIAVVYSSPFIMIIIGILTIELYGKNCRDGYFQFLISRRVSRAKTYLARNAATTVVSIVLYVLYGVLCYILSQFAFGFGKYQISARIVVLQFFVILATVSFYSLCICVFRKTVSTIVFVILTTIGAPAIMSFASSIAGDARVKYLWIGTCSTYGYDGDPYYGFILVVALMYTLISVGLGCLAFAKSDI